MKHGRSYYVHHPNKGWVIMALKQRPYLINRPSREKAMVTFFVHDNSELSRYNRNLTLINLLIE